MAGTTSISLLNRIQNPADNEAWTRFDRVYRDFVTKFLLNRGVDEHICEDVCQNALKQVYEAMNGGRFRHNGHTGAFRNWLRQVVVSQLAVYRRKSRRHESQLPSRLEHRLAKEDSRLVQIWNAEHNRFMLGLVLDLLRGNTSTESLAIFRRLVVEETDADQVAKEFGRTKNAVVVVKCKVLRKARKLAAELIN